MNAVVEKQKNARKSGIELLRLLTACAVIMLHYNDGKAFVHVLNGSFNQAILMFLESLCVCAVDIFILVSGYFLCKNPKRSIGKIVDNLAKASFTCFLIHGYFLRYIKIDYFVKQPFYIIGVHIILSIICIYLISYVGYRVYHFLHQE